MSGAVSFDVSRPTRRRQPAVPTRTAGAPPRPWALDVAVVAVGIGLGAVVGSTLTATTASQLRAAGGAATFAGNLAGMVGTYLALLMVLLVSRLPAVERVVGHDRLLRWHRRLAPWPLSLIAAHAVLLTVGYAQAAHTGAGHELGVLLGSYPGMVTATIAVVMMVGVGIISWRRLRERLPRETWWLIHLLMYLALALAFAHILALGPSFVGHPLARALWSALWVATAGLVIAYRVGLPLRRSLRHRLVVHEVRPEAPGVVSVILRGRDLDRLRLDGGQFFEWRFLTRGLWWQAHPYSVSALPRPPYLRLTVKAVGDHSQALARLHPGTRVGVEGPYGAFTRHAARRGRAALIAGGIGVTALRSLLEDLPRRSEPIVILRASTAADLALRDEVAELIRHRKGQLHEVIGARDEVRLDRRTLLTLAPDIRQRDVYVCGPPGFVDHVLAALDALGVDRDDIHHEAYAL